MWPNLSPVAIVRPIANGQVARRGIGAAPLNVGRATAGLRAAPYYLSSQMQAPPSPTTSRARTGRRPLLAAVVGSAAVLAAIMAAAAPRAEAHAAFLDSQPAPGVRLDRSPKLITLEFTEPLNEELTEIALVGEDGETAAARLEFGDRGKAILRPRDSLRRGAYRVDWYTVSTLDGHPLEGSFGFGVRAPAAGAASLEQSPLARDGWLRIGARAALYAALFFFAGGLMGAALLSPRGRPGQWLVPPEPAGPEADRVRVIAARAWSRTLAAGWLAAAAALAVALIETADASGGLSAAGVGDYLLANGAGLARVAVVVALLVAAAVARRAPRIAALAVAAGFLAIAISGHANSAEPRILAVATDTIHLLAAAIWIGGLAQLAAVWVPRSRRASPGLRLATIRTALPRFGRLALPAFLVVAASGLANALIQLGGVSPLWETAYGRVLAVKIALVGLIAAASYGHALRLRPRLVEGNPGSGAAAERRHWRLLASEPALALGVVAAAATLVGFPLPPQQLGESAAAAEPACEPCPVPEPRHDQLAVAEAAGTEITALWLADDGRGTIRVYDLNGAPAEVPLSLGGARLAGGCGEGCRRVRGTTETDELTVEIRADERPRAAVLPTGWDPRRTAAAWRLLARVQNEMRGLSRVRILERTSSGPGSVNTTTTLLRAPAQRRLMRANFRWAAYASSARWLGTGRERGRETVWLTVLDRATPVWYRLEVDPRSARVLGERLITPAHFIDRRYAGFGG